MSGREKTLAFLEVCGSILRFRRFFSFRLLIGERGKLVLRRERERERERFKKGERERVLSGEETRERERDKEIRGRLRGSRLLAD